jgi:hypothetical protein
MSDTKTHVNIEWEVMDTADFFIRDRDEMSEKQFARLIARRLGEVNGVEVSVSTVLRILNENQ